MSRRQHCAGARVVPAIASPTGRGAGNQTYKYLEYLLPSESHRGLLRHPDAVRNVGRSKARNFPTMYPDTLTTTGTHWISQSAPSVRVNQTGSLGTIAPARSRGPDSWVGSSSPPATRRM